MRRFLRLLVVRLIALALPLQGAAAATAMATHADAPSHVTMTMPDGSTMDAADMPGAVTCHGRAVEKSGCCGPLVAQQELLAVTPVAIRWAALRAVATAGSPCS
jgi:hypothetical protein